MDFFGLLTMIGGLALFLYGMKTMGDALSKLAGGKLEAVLEKMTDRPIKAVLLGAGVTAVIQSSSATTVMVVGFVNSGIMKLSQAVGVIMGANIGTTVTSWLLSLAGIEGTNFLIRMMKPSSFSPILALIGIILLMFVKDEKKNDIGTILIGFAILMFGMETMSSAVKPLANVPEFTSLLTAFENPILGMLAGAILTAIIQSSSASVGILQAMCATGSVTIGAALPVIMGQNIGTCVTALISAIGASKNARRTSLVHLYFNLIGTVVFMVVFYALNVFVNFAFLSETAGGATIAIIHSAFNIGATVLLLPASKLLEKLAYMSIPKTEDEDMPQEAKVLDPRFLERPAFAVAQCKNAVIDMAQDVMKSMQLCGILNVAFEESTMKKILEIEEKIDRDDDELSDYLTQLASKSLTKSDSENINMYGKAITDFERISDYCKGIAYAMKKLAKSESDFSIEAKSELQVIFAAVNEIVENTVQCFVHDDRTMALRIDPLADVVKDLKKKIRNNHGERLVSGTCSLELGMLLTDIVTSVERIAGHCSNIAEAELAAETDRYDFHEFARRMKEGNEAYKELVEEYREKFSLHTVTEG